MRILRNSIGLRLASVLGMMVLLMVVVGLAGWWGLYKVRAGASTFIEREFALTQTVADIRISMAQSRRFEKDVILAIGDGASVAQAKQRWDLEQIKLDLALGVLGAASGTVTVDDFAAVNEALHTYRTRFSGLFMQIEMQAIDNPMAANRLLRSIDEQFGVAQSALESMMGAFARASQSARLDMDTRHDHTLLLGSVIMAAAIVAAVLSALQLRRSIVVPLAHASQVASQVAEGNLCVRIETDQADELGQMMRSINRMVVALQDRSNRIEKEHKLSAALEQAVAASLAKSEFLALMSHELRTPMAGVIGMLSLALRQDMQDHLRQQIDLARSNAEILLKIVNDLLDLSKIEAGKMELEQIHFELATLMEESMLLLREGAKQSRISCTLSVDPALPPHRTGDPTRLRQILTNLMGNALKFTERGGIHVSVTRVEAPSELPSPAPKEPHEWLRFEVTDTGIGISEEALPRIFHKFEQADTSTTRKFGGTGLGLSICRELVQLMGGHIGVRSRVGEGSSFFVEVPLLIGEAPPQNEPYDMSPHAQSLHVLVAEDSHTNWVIISSLLEHMGHRHTLAENGQLALEALASGGEFDLVLMDGRMPVMDGLTATRHIRSGQWNGQAIPDPRIPIFGLTANAGASDREKFMNAGLDHFLSKPVNEEALHRALQGVIDKRPAVAIQPRSAALSYVREVPRRPVATPSAIDPEPAVAPRTKAEARRDALVKVFMEQAPQLIQEIKAATAQGDWPSAAMKVHSIKGSVAYFWPDSKIFQQCAELERLADHVQVAQFATLFAEMETELASLFQSSAKLQASH